MRGFYGVKYLLLQGGDTRHSVVSVLFELTAEKSALIKFTMLVNVFVTSCIRFYSTRYVYCASTQLSHHVFDILGYAS